MHTSRRPPFFPSPFFLVPPLPPQLSPYLPFFPLSVPLPLEVVPLNTARNLGERCKFPSESGVEPQRKSNWCVLALRINWSQCIYAQLHTVILQSFLARDSMLSALYATANPSVCLSVCLSVTRVDQSKTVEVRIMQFSPYSSPIPLVSTV